MATVSGTGRDPPITATYHLFVQRLSSSNPPEKLIFQQRYPGVTHTKASEELDQHQKDIFFHHFLATKWVPESPLRVWDFGVLIFLLGTGWVTNRCSKGLSKLQLLGVSTGAVAKDPKEYNGMSQEFWALLMPSLTLCFQMSHEASIGGDSCSSSSPWTKIPYQCLTSIHGWPSNLGHQKGAKSRLENQASSCSWLIQEFIGEGMISPRKIRCQGRKGAHFPLVTLWFGWIEMLILFIIPGRRVLFWSFTTFLGMAMRRQEMQLKGVRWCSNEASTICRCSSYWKGWISSAMFAFLCFFPILTLLCWNILLSDWTWKKLKGYERISDRKSQKQWSTINMEKVSPKFPLKKNIS